MFKRIATTRFPRTLAALAALLVIGALLLAFSQVGNAGSGDKNDGDDRPVPTRPADPDSIDHPTGRHDLILRVTLEGGFVTPEANLSRLPIFSLFGDGTYVIEGPVPAIYPPPALPNLQAGRLTEEGIQHILRQARDAGLLDGDRTYGPGPIFDAATTVFTINAGGHSFVTRVTDLSGESNPDMDATERAARAELVAFVGNLPSSGMPLAAELIAESERAFAIDRLQLIVIPDDSPYAPPVPEDIRLAAFAWPLASDLATFGAELDVLPGTRIGVVEGAELPVLLAELQQTNTLTRWLSNGEAYVLIAVPLMPDAPAS